ncbi:DUF6262 family protein [Brachybacterium sacelli]|uniref:Uncharacterized protein YlxW (UPF0749 family) n=1 Tax=Brachybacterium sacelli TaxID=173364 RepID=A0ABS4X1N7_9MICO|nr:DUF6262 family protein [Brachybacterium sacelli]MBP2382308.1 uncharacterized protein YlxW (UPF0749 family) [Brachybacterium sacelli]
MSTREERVERLTETRRLDSAYKRTAALDAVKELIRAGQPVTFAAVGRAASVSSWFVYNNVTVRAAIEAARSRPETRSAQTASATPAGLRADLTLARAEIKQLREERDRLLAQVRRGLGSALESRDRDALLEQVRDLERQRNQLNSELFAARAELAKSQESVQLLAEELDAARGAVRRMMRDSAKTPPT